MRGGGCLAGVAVAPPALSHAFAGRSLWAGAPRSVGRGLCREQPGTSNGTTRRAAPYERTIVPLSPLAVGVRNRGRFGSRSFPVAEHDGSKNHVPRRSADRALLRSSPLGSNFFRAAVDLHMSLDSSAGHLNGLPKPVRRFSACGSGVTIGDEFCLLDENRPRPRTAPAPARPRRRALQPRLGRGHAEHADQGRLAGGRVLAGRPCRPVAGSPSTSSRSSAIWNASPDRGAVAVERRALAPASAWPRMPPATQPKRSSAPVFIACSVATSCSPSCCARAVVEAALGGEIEHLAADHAAEPGRARQRQHQLEPHRRHRDGSRAATGCRTRRSAARRRPGSRSPRRTPCARSAGRAAGRRCPWPAGRRAPANSSARIRAPRPPSGRAARGTPNRAALSTTRNGRKRLPPPRLA